MQSRLGCGAHVVGVAASCRPPSDLRVRNSQVPRWAPNPQPHRREQVMAGRLRSRAASSRRLQRSGSFALRPTSRFTCRPVLWCPGRGPPVEVRKRCTSRFHLPSQVGIPLPMLTEGAAPLWPPSDHWFPQMELQLHRKACVRAQTILKGSQSCRRIEVVQFGRSELRERMHPSYLFSVDVLDVSG